MLLHIKSSLEYRLVLVFYYDLSISKVIHTIVSQAIYVKTTVIHAARWNHLFEIQYVCYKFTNVKTYLITGLHGLNCDTQIWP